MVDATQGSNEPLDNMTTTKKHIYIYIIYVYVLNPHTSRMALRLSMLVFTHLATPAPVGLAQASAFGPPGVKFRFQSCHLRL